MVKNKLKQQGIHGLSVLYNQLFPEQCLYCKDKYLSWGQVLCESCIKNIPFFIPKNTCLVCGESLQDEVCFICSRKQIFFNKANFFFFYSRVAKTLLKLAKFENRRGASKTIKRLIEQNPYGLKALENLVSDQTVLLEICSSRAFLSTITQYISTKFGIPVLRIFKKEDRQMQSKLLHEKDRYLCIEKNLLLRPNVLKKNNKVLLLDDVWTTGATLNYAAKLVSEQGIPTSNIHVCALFRRNRQVNKNKVNLEQSKAA